MRLLICRLCVFLCNQCCGLDTQADHGVAYPSLDCLATEENGNQSQTNSPDHHRSGTGDDVFKADLRFDNGWPQRQANGVAGHYGGCCVVMPNYRHSGYT
ncbi:hypothetical protein D3C80_1354930 [compost metagenome]